MENQEPVGKVTRPGFIFGPGRFIGILFIREREGQIEMFLRATNTITMDAFSKDINSKSSPDDKRFYGYDLQTKIWRYIIYKTSSDFRLPTKEEWNVINTLHDFRAVVEYLKSCHLTRRK